MIHSTCFTYRDGELWAESVALAAIAAEYGTPAFVYSRAAIEGAWRDFDDALSGIPHLVCFAVKANSNLAVLNILAKLGSGFDIVSVGELERVLAAGGEREKIVFSGVGKTKSEMERALEVGIRCFNVESTGELARLSEVAQHMGRVAPVSIRVNPDVDPQTHPYIATGLSRNKFGIAIEDAPTLFERALELPGLDVCGVDCHIGSQLTSLDPYRDAMAKVFALVDRLTALGVSLSHVDVGGGLGIQYRDEVPPSIADYGAVVKRALGARDLEIVVEPGRAICGNAGVLVTRVEYLKRNGEHRFAIVDAAMNDYIRPALYDAYCEIAPVRGPSADEMEVEMPAGPPAQLVDVVGPVCETGDFLGRGRALRAAPGDLLALFSAGAYGFVMSSNYNSRPRAPELVVDGADVHLARPRESLRELFATEAILPN